MLVRDTKAQEIEPNEPISHRDLIISYTIGRDGSITAKAGDESLTVQIPQLENIFWSSVIKTVVNKNITTIQFSNGIDNTKLTLNMTDNILVFDLEGSLSSASLLNFKLSDNAKLLGKDRAGITLSDGNEFYFDWSDIPLPFEYIEGSKTLRVNLVNPLDFKLDPIIALTNHDFETGDFTGWTTFNDDPVFNTIEVNSTNPINGSFSARFDYQLDGGSKRLTALQNIPASNDTTLQFQVRIDTDNLITDKGVILGGIKNASGDDTALHRRAFVIYNHNVTDGIEFLFGFHDDVGVNLTTTAPASPDTVFCITMRYLKGETDNTGLVTFLVDDTLILNSTIDNNSFGSHDTIFNGVFNNMPSNQGIDLEFRTDENRAFSGPTTLLEIECPEIVIPEPPVIDGDGLTDFFPIAINGIFISWIVGAFFIAFGHKRNVFITALGMILLLSGFMLQLNPIFATITNGTIAYQRLDFPIETRNNLALVSSLLMGVGMFSFFISSADKSKSGARRYLFG